LRRRLDGAQAGPMRRSNFNKMPAWPYAVRAIDAAGLYFHDLRHTGNRQPPGGEEWGGSA
jgi:hypothetical protein